MPVPGHASACAAPMRHQAATWPRVHAVPTRSSSAGRQLPAHHPQIEGDGDIAVLGFVHWNCVRSSEASTRESDGQQVDRNRRRSSPTIVQRVLMGTDSVVVTGIEGFCRCQQPGCGSISRWSCNPPTVAFAPYAPTVRTRIERIEERVSRYRDPSELRPWCQL